jgi:hypothetical protein
MVIILSRIIPANNNLVTYLFEIRFAVFFPRKPFSPKWRLTCEYAV